MNYGTSQTLISELQKIADSEIAEHAKRFFKSGPGEYGEGDRFLGIRVPEQRKTAKKFSSLELDEIKQLLDSDWHEVRLTALFILVLKYQKADENLREEIFLFYISNLDRVNNWDLVDSTARQIAGHYLFGRNRELLFELAVSDNLWKRRVAIIATHYFIQHGDLDDTFKISDILLNDNHDLIHKAVGWMLREAGKVNIDALNEFLLTRCKNMPRTMLRYAIEKMPDERRKGYLEGTIKN